MEVICPSRSAWLSFDEIGVSDIARPYNATDVMALVGSIRAIGLVTPLTVIRRDGRFVLVAGRHRLEALRVIGADKVPVRIVDMDDIDARLWTISENLHRTELTALERSEQIAEWIKLTAEKAEADKNAEVLAQVAQNPQGGRPEGGVRAAARELGVDRDSARRAVKIASITSEAKEAVRSAGLADNQSALLKVASHFDQDQVEAVGTIVKERAEAPKAETPTASPLRDLKNIAAGEFVRWIRMTTPDNPVRVIRLLRMAASILEGGIGHETGSAPMTAHEEKRQ
jgi:ParB family transcriptional regulator, chromosome partitioning protein